MRMLKLFGTTLLVGALGGAVVLAASDSTSVNASFAIPSWISLSIVGNGDVSFSNIEGPGSYDGTNNTQLRVLSTTSWTISDTILWSESQMPRGSSQAAIESALQLTYDDASGSWGIHLVNVSYTFELDVDDMGNLPEGDYNLVIQYTATTD